MDPHRLMMFCMKMAGMISLTGGTLLKCYSYYMFTSFLIFGSSLVTYICLDQKPIIDQIQTFHYLIAVIQIFFKFMSIFRNQKETVDILTNIQNLSKEAIRDPLNKKIIEWADKLSSRITKIYLFVFCAYYPLRVTNLLIKYLLFRRPPQLFLDGTWIPQFIQKHYILGIFYQVLTSLCVGFTNASYTCLVFFITLQMAAQLKVLTRMLKETLPLKESIILHQKLMRLFLRVNRLLAGLMFVEIVMASFYSCIYTFLILQSLSSGDKEVAHRAHILFLVLIRSFMICLCGDIIIKQGEKLHTSAYFGNWYDNRKTDRVSLLFVMTLTTVQPFKYNYRHLATIDMTQYMKSMQTAYSYLTMLLSLTNY